MRKIIADSSANLLSLSGAAFQSIPMVIHAGERDFLDDARLDTGDMMDYLSTFKGRSGTALPRSRRLDERFRRGRRDFRCDHHQRPVRHLRLRHGRQGPL